jgi:hypothetical protein
MARRPSIPLILQRQLCLPACPVDHLKQQSAPEHLLLESGGVIYPFRGLANAEPSLSARCLPLQRPCVCSPNPLGVRSAPTLHRRPAQIGPEQLLPLKKPLLVMDLEAFNPIARLSGSLADLIPGKKSAISLRIISCLLNGASATFRNAITVAYASNTWASIGIPPAVLPKS